MREKTVPRAEHQPTATHCPYCALQCGMMLRDESDGRVAVTAGVQGVRGTCGAGVRRVVIVGRGMAGTAWSVSCAPWTTPSTSRYSGPNRTLPTTASC